MQTQTRIVLAAVAAVVLTAVIAVSLTLAATTSDDSSPPSPQVPNCQYEDGSASANPCYWDGGPNGKGERYIIWNDNVYTQSGYLDHNGYLDHK